MCSQPKRSNTYAREQTVKTMMNLVEKPHGTAYIIELVSDVEQDALPKGSVYRVNDVQIARG